VTSRRLFKATHDLQPRRAFVVGPSRLRQSADREGRRPTPLAKRVRREAGNTTGDSHVEHKVRTLLTSKSGANPERQISLIFQRAREEERRGLPRHRLRRREDSLFRTAAPAISRTWSHDRPQLLAEIARRARRT